MDLEHPTLPALDTCRSCTGDVPFGHNTIRQDRLIRITHPDLTLHDLTDNGRVGTHDPRDLLDRYLEPPLLVWLTHNDLVRLATTNIRTLCLLGGSHTLGDIAGDYHRLLEWKHDRAEEEPASSLPGSSESGSSPGSAWHAGFEIDSDGHWTPISPDALDDSYDRLFW